MHFGKHMANVLTGFVANTHISCVDNYWLKAYTPISSTDPLEIYQSLALDGAPKPLAEVLVQFQLA